MYSCFHCLSYHLLSPKPGFTLTSGRAENLLSRTMTKKALFVEQHSGWNRCEACVWPVKNYSGVKCLFKSTEIKWLQCCCHLYRMKDKNIFLTTGWKKPSSITDHIPVSFSEGESAWEKCFFRQSTSVRAAVCLGQCHTFRCSRLSHHNRSSCSPVYLFHMLLFISFLLVHYNPLLF